MADGPDDTWTVARLRAHAAEHDIDVAGLRKKADLLDRIAEHEAAQVYTVLAETNRSIDHAITGKTLDADKHAGPIAALRVLARRIDEGDALMAIMLRLSRDAKVKPPAIDNVSIPTYLKYCEAMGLTPAAEKPEPAKPEGSAGGGKVHKLRAVHGQSA